MAALIFAGVFEVTTAQQFRAYVVNIHEPIQLETVQVVERAIEIAARSAGIVILRVSAPNGNMDAAQAIVQDIAAAQIPVFSLVTAPTWGPTAIVSLMADSLFMGPSSSVGAAASSTEMWRDVPPDDVSAMREAFLAAAQLRGLDPQIGAAMVDPSVSIPGAVGAGEVLILDPDEAVRLGLAAGRSAGLEEMFEQLGLDAVEVVTVDASWVGTTVRVSNRNFREVVVYVERSGTRFRLGLVTSMRSSQFDVPGTMLIPGSVIQVVADVVGSPERINTEEIRVAPGLVIEWVIENEIVHSNYFVYIKN